MQNGPAAFERCFRVSAQLRKVCRQNRGCKFDDRSQSSVLPAFTKLEYTRGPRDTFEKGPVQACWPADPGHPRRWTSAAALSKAYCGETLSRRGAPMRVRQWCGV